MARPRPEVTVSRLLPVLVLLVTPVAGYSQMVPAYVPPKADGPVVDLLDEGLDALLPLLTNTGGGEPGTAQREDRDVFAGLAALRVKPIQKYQPRLPGWDFRVVEKPQKAGEFRFLRYAWKKRGGTGVMVQLHDPTRSWVVRYVAGPNSVGWQATSVADAAPAGWAVVTRDLFKDYGDLTLTGIAFTPMDGDGGLFDHVLLGRTVADLDRATDAALGRVTPAAPPADERIVSDWHALTDPDPGTARAALCRLLAAAPRSATVIRRAMAERPDVGGEGRRIAGLITDLDSDRFEVRAAAAAALRAAGEPAVEPLRTAVRSSASAEVRFRAADLLRGRPNGTDLPVSALRSARLVRVLERAATAESKEFLAELGDGRYGPEYVEDGRAASGRP